MILIRYCLLLSFLFLLKSCASLTYPEYADNLYKEGKYYEALYYFTLDLQNNPGSYEAHLGRGKCLLLLERYEEALIEFSLAAGRKKSGEVFYRRALAYLYLNKPDKSINDLNESIKLDASNPDAYFTRGYIYSLKSEPEKALADYDRALQIKPGWVEALVNRGNIKSVMGYSDQAIDDFSIAISSDSLNSKAFLNRANELALSGNFQDALKDYNKVLMLDSTNMIALELRAETYKFLGIIDSAIIDYTSLLRIDAGRADIYFERGKMFLQKENLPAACKDFTTAGEMGYFKVYELINKFCK